MQYSHSPQAQPSQGIATRSPSATRVTPGPVRWTMPTPSWPGTKGGVGLTGQSPLAACMSVWHRPEASIFTRTWPSPGSGIGRSSMTRGCLNALTTAALMGCSFQRINVDRAVWPPGRAVSQGPTATVGQDFWPSSYGAHDLVRFSGKPADPRRAEDHARPGRGMRPRLGTVVSDEGPGTKRS